MHTTQLPANFIIYKATLNEPHFHMTRGEEYAFEPDHTDWSVNNILYINDVGITLPSPNYEIIREEGHDKWRSLYVFEYVLSGRGHIECGKQKYTVGPGDLYFLNRLHSHRYYADPDDPFCKLWINVCGRLLNTLVELYGLSEGVIIRHYDAEQIFKEMHALTSSLNLSNRTEVCHTVSLHLHTLIQVLSGSDQRDADITDSANRAEQIKRYIDSHNTFDLSLDDIASHFFLNKAYLSRIFRQTYQMTPKQYLQIRRIEAAQNMLSNSNTSIRLIAETLHFTSPQHFSAMFHQVIGLTPGEYRRKYS
ncbi:MAG: helix-turn-helix transcriptional regulator [Clostridia bacterium]|nr:helix-turn-helix transcriptional regulator [Clostridia bacterium]